MSLRKPPSGFTLIELLIAMAVVAILATIAIPSYQDSVRKSRRAQAKADLVELAQRLERHHTVQNSYADFEGVDDDFPSPSEGTAHYTITIDGPGGADEPTADAFVLTAAPEEETGQNKDPCNVLTLSSTGTKGVSEADEGWTTEQCW